MVALPSTVPASPRRRIDPELIVWGIVIAAVSGCFALREHAAWMASYPDGWTLPLSGWINQFMEWFVEHFQGFFKAISWVLEWPMDWIRDLLEWLPWPATIAAFAVLAFVSAGWRLALFTVASMFYMVLIGYWSESMRTLALVFVSVPLAVGVGLFVGIAAFKWPGCNRVVQPTLDVMQTLPTFAYLIPILLLFGFGPVVGLIASAIYACPPMVRNVILGLQRVPTEVVESALMSGATRRQLLWWVQVPSSSSNIMMGVNQTLMAALSMVIIAAIIGSSADIGWEVLDKMRKARFGDSLLAGAVICLIAMNMDRISRGFVGRQRSSAATGSLWVRYRAAWVVLISTLGFVGFSKLVPALREYPDELVFYPADEISAAVSFINVQFADFWEALKRKILFFFLLPLRIGFETAIRPFSWGFELTPAITNYYAIGVTVVAAVVTRLWSWRGAVGVLLFGGLMYFGVSKIPWPALILVVSVLAWQVGGWRLGLFAIFAISFLAVAGIWDVAMGSIYLCAAAVATSFVLGAFVGITAANNDRISALVRPISDTLQTIPLFVFLIPVLMFFAVGDFSAYLAIILYATVPAARYTEQGLRQAPSEIIEAATACGCTPRQILWQVKIPLAIPEIMLGLNQTVMFGLAMLVIAALVGTRELGQQIYVALGAADTGAGMVAGIAITLIAMLTDRILQSWSARKKAALGL